VLVNCILAASLPSSIDELYHLAARIAYRAIISNAQIFRGFHQPAHDETVVLRVHILRARSVARRNRMEEEFRRRKPAKKRILSESEIRIGVVEFGEVGETAVEEALGDDMGLIDVLSS
jgi:hypothetical protein